MMNSKLFFIVTMIPKKRYDFQNKNVNLKILSNLKIKVRSNMEISTLTSSACKRNTQSLCHQTLLEHEEKYPT